VGIKVQPELDDMYMDLLGSCERAHTSACLEEEGEGVLAGEDVASAHGYVEGERVGRVGLGADEGVPHEGVGTRGGVEDSESEGEVAEGGEGAREEQAARGEGVGGDDGGDDHLGMDLLQLV